MIRLAAHWLSEAWNGIDMLHRDEIVQRETMGNFENGPPETTTALIKHDQMVFDGLQFAPVSDSRHQQPCCFKVGQAGFTAAGLVPNKQNAEKAQTAAHMEVT